MLGKGNEVVICITGDLHGDFDRLCVPELKKLKSRDVLIVCGDFGFVWDGSKEEQKILKKIGKRRYDTLFVEGCHDNYELLKEYPVVAYKGGKARKEHGHGDERHKENRDAHEHLVLCVILQFKFQNGAKLFHVLPPHACSPAYSTKMSLSEGSNTLISSTS